MGQISSGERTSRIKNNLHRFAAAGAAISAVFALGSGCSGDTSAGNGGGTGPTIDQVPGLYADALCQLVSKCLGATLTNAFLHGEDCKTLVEKQIQQDAFSVVPTSVKENRIVYRPDHVNACIAAIKARTCAQFSDRAPDECNQALEGTIADGAECSIDNECVPGSFCDAQTQCPGKCKTRLLAGDKCSRDDDCQSGLVCSADTGLCVAPAGKGESCEGGVAPPCQFGLLCLGAKAPAPGKCTDPAQVLTAAVGAACDPTNASGPQLCAEGSDCAAMAISGATVTWQCVSPVASGAACHPAFPDMCPDNQYCNVPAMSLAGTCTDLPAANAPCATESVGGKQCVAGLVCDGTICRELQSLGSPCNINDGCYSKTCVNGGCVRSDFCTAK